MSELVAIRLEEGRFADHSNVYPLEWPPPERIVAFLVDGKVAIALTERLEQARVLDPEATVYVKRVRSVLPEIPDDIPMVRGAAYVVETSDV